MTQNAGKRVFNGIDQPHHGFFFGHFQVGVNRSDDQVEICQYFVGIIKASIVQDIALNTLINTEGGQSSIKLIYLLVLRIYPVNIKSACIKSAYIIPLFV